MLPIIFVLRHSGRFVSAHATLASAQNDVPLVLKWRCVAGEHGERHQAVTTLVAYKGLEITETELHGWDSAPESAAIPRRRTDGLVENGSVIGVIECPGIAVPEGYRVNVIALNGEHRYQSSDGAQWVGRLCKTPGAAACEAFSRAPLKNVRELA